MRQGSVKWILLVTALFFHCSGPPEERTEVIEKWNNGNPRITHRYKGNKGSEKLVEIMGYSKKGEVILIVNPQKRIKKELLENFEGWPRVKREFKDGRPSGIWIFWDTDGQVRQKGTYRSGLKHGKWRRWNEKGELVLEERYRDGQLIE